MSGETLFTGASQNQHSGIVQPAEFGASSEKIAEDLIVDISFAEVTALKME